MEFLGLVFVFLLGLALGSFINVLVYRVPKGMVITGRSVCPKCKKQIVWYDNIPLLSYFLLAGKCRKCGGRISLRYPLIELVSGMVLLLVTLMLYKCFTGGALCLWSNSISVFSYPLFWIISVCLLAIFFIDLREMIIPDELVFMPLSLITVLLVALPSPLFFVHLASGFLAAMFLLLINLFTRGKGMGLGDVKLAVLSGAVLGGYSSVIWLFLAFLTGAAAGIILILVGRARLSNKIAFGPFLILSFFIALVWGNNLFQIVFFR